MGLNCSPHPDTPLSVLHEVAPHLQVLELLRPYRDHLQVVASMANLRALFLPDCDLKVSPESTVTLSQADELALGTEHVY